MNSMKATNAGTALGRATAWFVAALIAVSATAIAPACADTFLYVGSYTTKQPGPGTERTNPIGLSVFRLNAKSGDLASVQEVPSNDPSFVALHPSGAYLYVNNEVANYEGNASGSVEAYRIDHASGRLTLLNRQSLNSPIPSQLAIDPTGRYAVVSSFVGGEYIVLPIGRDGRLGQAKSVWKNSGRGPDAVRQPGPRPHGVVFDPTGKFVAAVDLGIDKLQVFRFERGRFVLASEADLPPGSGPRHSVYGVDGRHIYVVNELTATIAVFSVDTDGRVGKMLQTISTYPADYTGFRNAAEIALHSSGKFLYASNRANDSLASFTVDPKTGLLTSTGYMMQGVKFPRSFTVDPSGRWLYVGNQTTDEIMRYDIDPTTSMLAATGRATPSRTPVVLTFGK